MREHLPGLMALLLFGCGGEAVVDGAGGRGGDTTSTTSTSGSTSSTTTSTGPSGCNDHGQCPGGSVCIFATGTCAEPCGSFCEPCGPGSICNGCATSSCPDCADCIAACVPTSPGQCDDHDDCGVQEVCIYGSGSCAPTCDSPDCADPNMVCMDCVTASCPCCEDCGSACLPAP